MPGSQVLKFMMLTKSSRLFEGIVLPFPYDMIFSNCFYMRT